MPLPDGLMQYYEDNYAKDHAPPRTPKRGEAMFEGTDYPRTWDGFIGQEMAKTQLQVQVASAKARGTRIEHTLIASGQHGCGKSTLATLLAAQAGVGIIQVSGALTVDDARALFKACNDHDVVFIDEAHLLVAGNKNRADWLLPFMTEGKLYTKRGAEQMPNIAIVGATTDVGRLPQTIISRFMVRPVIEAYSNTEATQIAEQLAQRMSVDVGGDYLPRIARAANKNPRDMRMILTALRDIMLAFPDTPPDFDLALKWSGLSYDGLGTVAQDILLVLLASDKHTCSIESIQAQLGEPGPLKHHEQNLLQRSFITVTGRGRQLTDQGRERALQLVKERR